MGPTEIETQRQHYTPSLPKWSCQTNQITIVDAPSPSSAQNYPPTNNSASQRALRSEALRLATFQGWPLDFLSPRDLSSAGFFYRGIADQTQCAFCCITISQWEPQDNPMTEHRRHAPNCPFVLQLPVGNVPLSTSNRAPVSRASPLPPLNTSPPLFVPSLNGSGSDTCSRFQNESRPNAMPEQVHAPTLTIRPHDDGEGTTAGGDMTSLRLMRHQQARYPELSSMEARLATFADWPPGLEQRPAQLAEAGFYYMKTGDHVKCFCCDGALRNWEPKDDPWVEHARWFSRCNYLLSTKGIDYIKEIQNCLQEKTVGASAATQDAIEVKEVKIEYPIAQSSESAKIRDSLLCQICCDQQLSMVFLPCGHSMSCPSCATALTTCPLCRKRIDATVRAFFPFS